MMQPHQSRMPVLFGTFRLIMAIFVLGLAATLAFSLFGWAFHVFFFVFRLAVIATLIGIGIRLLSRSRN
jgi:hypothetical protein